MNLFIILNYFHAVLTLLFFCCFIDFGVKQIEVNKEIISRLSAIEKSMEVK